MGCDEDDTCAEGLFTGSGDGFTCLYTSCGTVYCWGRNDHAQVGELALGLEVSQPTRVQGTGKVIGGSSGRAFSCAVTDLGDVVCWGGNEYAQSTGTTPTAAAIEAPETVTLVGGAAQLASGEQHSCARLTDGRVQCWGDNSALQLGSATASAHGPGPVEDDDLIELTGVVDLAMTRTMSCVVLDSRDLVCWGLLAASGWFFSTPNAFAVLAYDIEQVAGGYAHLLAEGAFGLMGVGNSRCAQCGVAYPYNTLTAFVPIDLPLSAKLSAGQLQSCALIGTDVYCFGDSRHGQLGIGGTCVDAETANDDHVAPVCGSPLFPDPGLVPLPGPAHDLAARYSHTCVLVRSGGELLPYCWGEGSMGELGPDAPGCSSSPVAVAWPPGSTP